MLGRLLFVLCIAMLALHGGLAEAEPPYQNRVTGTCPVGSSIRVINADGSVVCEVDDNSGGTVTSVSTGSGLTGGPITTSGTLSIATGGVTSAHIADGTVGAVDVNPAQVQLRVTGTCATGSAIRVVDQSGTVTCQSVGSGTVTAVTASPPLASSGGTTLNISLPNVIIDTVLGNTAIGVEALLSNTTGTDNTASGVLALASNTTGSSNTASGIFALLANTTGFNNTASGRSAAQFNTTGSSNTASGFSALTFNTTGFANTASGVLALQSNTTGNLNTAIGFAANVASGNLSNATAIGANAIVDASNKIRLGDANVTVIEGQVDFTFTSDKHKKENIQPVDGEEVLRKLRGLTVTSWNYIGHDPTQFRHYGPMGQEFFAAFGHDGIGTIGSPTTITSADMAGVLMIAVQTLERHTAVLQQENALLKESVEALKAANADLRARFDAAVARETLAQK
jgi:Chaperone of endosialidase